MKTDFIYQNITNKIVAMLEKGISPWKKTWRAENMPMNLTTKYNYRGINVWLLLASENATTPYWITYNQLKKADGTLKSGEEKSYETIIYFQISKIKDRFTGEEKTVPFIKYTRVWNLSQINISPEKYDKLVPKVVKREVNEIDGCEEIVKNYKTCPDISYGGDRAYYAPLFDNIQMPPKKDFESDEKFYGVLFHEMGHSTGAEKRLNRFKAADSNIFASESYSKEELIAEMTSSFLSATAGISNELIVNSAAYLKGWLSAIQDGEKNFLVSAASKASFAADYILGKERK
jgi:antirestriction protein ArdC